MHSKPMTHRAGHHEPAMQPLRQRVAAERRAHASRFWLERLLAILAGALLLVLLVWAPASQAAIAARVAPPSALSYPVPPPLLAGQPRRHS